MKRSIIVLALFSLFSVPAFVPITPSLPLPPVVLLPVTPASTTTATAGGKQNDTPTCPGASPLIHPFSHKNADLYDLRVIYQKKVVLLHAVLKN